MLAGIPCRGRCPHGTGARWPRAPATSGGGANTLKDDGLKTSASLSRKGTLIPLVLGQSGRAWGSWSPRTPSVPASGLSPHAPEPGETVVPCVFTKWGRREPTVLSPPPHGSWAGCPAPVWCLGESSPVFPAACDGRPGPGKPSRVSGGLGGRGGSTMVKMCCAVCCAGPGGRVAVAALPGPSDRPRARGCHRSGGLTVMVGCLITRSLLPASRTEDGY